MVATMTAAMLTTAEAAEVLRVTPYRVRELIRDGRIYAVHHPSAYHWQIPAAELKRYISSDRKPRGIQRRVDAKNRKATKRSTR